MVGGWKVLLLGGASGTGKSQVSYPLARRYGVALVELDDIVEALQAVTTPEQQPLLHYWRTHPEAAHLPPDEIVRLQIATCEALAPAVEAVVANHLETGTSVVIEGDYLLPSLAAELVRRSVGAGQGTGRNAGRGADGTAGGRGEVAAVFLHEPDRARLVENYRRREPGAGEQTGRAEVSARYGDWLAARAAEAGVPVVPARPWDDTLQRVVEALGR
ncbi:hypothetical protein ACFOWE_21615 [Planomonospora corallina]|uniref:2-phosphoglycerate kinase n=1 Tax=Planomonospora corallina TaxID=1806052 RepID=A0ABV8ICY3_9ACTN